MSYIERIKSINKELWYDVYHKLNCWEWPSQLGRKPFRWKSDLNDEKHAKYKRPIIQEVNNFIRKEIGYKELLRHHNVVRLKSCDNAGFEKKWDEWLKNGSLIKSYL